MLGNSLKRLSDKNQSKMEMSRVGEMGLIVYEVRSWVAGDGGERIVVPARRQSSSTKVGPRCCCIKLVRKRIVRTGPEHVFY